MVIVGYTDLAGVQREFRAEWSVVDVPQPEDDGSVPSAGAALALGLDLEGDVRRRINAVLFSPQKLAERSRIRQARASAGYTPEEAVAIATAAAVQGLQSVMPYVFDVQTLNLGGKKIGYLRIEPTRAQFAVTPLTVELAKAGGQLAVWMPSLERDRRGLLRRLSDHSSRALQRHRPPLHGHGRAHHRCSEQPRSRTARRAGRRTCGCVEDHSLFREVRMFEEASAATVAV